MVSFQTLIVFFPVALLLVVTPGPDFVFVTATSAVKGARAGACAATGISLAMMVHVTLAGLGIAELMHRYPLAFEIVRYLGAGFFLYLAWKALRAVWPHPSVGVDVPVLSQDLSYALRGFVTNLLNPKAAIITSLVFIQFVDPAAGPLFPQFLTLGVVISTQMLVFYCLLSLTTGRVRGLLVGRARLARLAERAVGALFIGFAVRLLLMERPR